MPAPNRFEIVAPLPSQKRHLHLAVDRGSSPPRAVVLALYPRALSDDPGRLERLAGEMERAAQLVHPNIIAPVGMEAVGDDLAAVTVWRDAITVREILDAGGALPPDIAARIAADVCAGLSHAHGRPQPVVHGLVRPEAVLLDETGTATVSGFGIPGGSGIADDMLGVGELLHECLAGEPPDDPTVPLDESEAPPPLVAVVNQARAASAEARHPTADALGAAIAQAMPLATREAVAAYVNAVLPSKSGVRAERREKIAAALASAPSVSVEEITDEDITEVAPLTDYERTEPDLVARAAAASDAAASGAEDPSPTAAGAVASPPSPEPSSPEASPAGPPSPPRTTTSPSMRAATATTTPIATGAATPKSTPAQTTTPRSTTSPSIRTSTSTAISADAPSPTSTTLPPTDDETPAAPSSPHPPLDDDRRDRRRRGVSVLTAIAMCLFGVAGGFAIAAFTPWHEFLDDLLRRAGYARVPATPSGTVSTRDARAPEPVVQDGARAAEPSVPDGAPTPEPAEAEESAEPVAKPPPARVRRASESAPDKKSRVRRAVAAASPKPEAKPEATGVLVVTAPDDETEIWLDGRRIGAGNLRKQIPVGDHRVEVRRGRAKVGEKFHIEAGEIWTYAVTPK